MAKKIYPDWVQEQKVKGTTVKKVGNNYYLYKHSSKRVPGKKNPVPVDTYIGRITPDGIEKGEVRKISTTDTEVVVKEYGFSYAVEKLCTAGWKEVLGKDWQGVLDFIIVRESPESYIPQIRKVPDALDSHIQYGAQKAALQRRMKQEYGVGFKELLPLTTIYLVRFSGKSFISKISETQEELLKRLGLRMEVH